MAALGLGASTCRGWSSAREREFDIDRSAPVALVERRRGRATLDRRNRFLARRKMGRADAATMVAQILEG